MRTFYHIINQSTTEDNIAEIIADIFVDIIRTTAGLTSPDVLVKQKQLQSSGDLKVKYGKYLLKECDNHCPMSGCSKLLFVSNATDETDVYEISRIDKKKDSTINNLIALCPQCFATYQMDTSSTITKELVKAKKALSKRMENMIDLDNMQLEKGLTSVILNLKKLKDTDLDSLTMNPVELTSKIDKTNNLHLYLMVNTYVTTYFIKIREILQSLDKQKKLITRICSTK